MSHDANKGSDQAGLEDLEARIRHAEKRVDADTSVNQLDAPDNAGPQAKGGNPAFDMLATLLGSMALGWMIDQVLGTSPWVMIGMIPAGFGIVLVNIWRALAKTDKDAQS